MYELVMCVENVSIVKLKCGYISTLHIYTTLEYKLLLNVWKMCEMKKNKILMHILMHYNFFHTHVISVELFQIIDFLS